MAYIIYFGIGIVSAVALIWYAVREYKNGNRGSFIEETATSSVAAGIVVTLFWPFLIAFGLAALVVGGILMLGEFIAEKIFFL